ncbi:U6 snRNP-associated protein Lsm7 [Friedmanniomyces endolithicus]|uniref:U6 snRNP-associated protein Lsm7 n=1 Tax=Friedmanniomyces endolithicus TaxID=329885 RepID=A0AAN6J6M2_9PEZI|nr:U6 snRNP-associated protein Lsm7 [Friedmanniomyces endolithicus]
MSERGNFRGGGGGGRGNRGDRGGRGGGERGGRGGSQAQGGDRKKENILDLTKYMDKEIMVKFTGVEKVRWNPLTGMLKGYDQLMNLVLDNVKEVTRDDEGNTSSRSLGLLVARGTLLVLISPVDGSEEIENPFVQADDDE